MYIFRFQRFQVYKDALRFRIEIKRVVNLCFPQGERFILSNQILRATTSIILNIAEGSDRSTDKDFALFLNRALTSLNEVVACLDVAILDKYISKDLYQQRISEASNLADQMTAFRKKLLKDKQSNY